MIDISVLRENDIRGVFGEGITNELALKVGKAYGTYLTNINKKCCVVGYDNRVSGEELVEYVVEKGTPVLENSAKLVKDRAIVVTKQILKKLEQEEKPAKLGS